jgi:Uncharacterized conserved protein
VLPVTIDNVQLGARYEDGREQIGQHHIDQPSDDFTGAQITDIWLTPPAQLTTSARTALATADFILLGPGDLFTSILPNCIVAGFAAAIPSTTPVGFVQNLMNKRGQTEGMTRADYVAVLARYLGRMPDIIFLNMTPLPAALLAEYERRGDYPVFQPPTADRLVQRPLINVEPVTLQPSDVVARSLIRHDPDKLASAIMDVL